METISPVRDMDGTRPRPGYWLTTPLSAMSAAEWEALCDGCGRCCLIKLEDEESGIIHVTDVVCRLFDENTCRCRDYDNRSEQVPDCIRLTPQNVTELSWLPETCAYRLVSEGRDLAWWHPLVSGDPETVVEAGISVRGLTGGHEDEFDLAGLVERICDWTA